MAWTAPKTWSVNELVTAALLNTHLRDNLLFLLPKIAGYVEHREGSTYQTTSETFVDIDATDLSLTVNLEGNALFAICGVMEISGDVGASVSCLVDLRLDGTTVAGDGILGLAQSQANNTRVEVTLLGHWTSLSAGNHTIRPVFKRSGGSGTVDVKGDRSIFIVAFEA